MKSFLKFLSRNKLYTLIEIFGLTVSLAFVIYMGNYVGQQFGIANEHPDRENIYILGMPGNPGLTFGFNGVLEGKFPEIEKIAKYCPEQDGYAMLNGKDDRHHIKYIAVDKNFIEMFPQYILEGSAETFDDVNNVFVSERFANLLSQNKKEIKGMTLEIDDVKYNIAGIVKNFDKTLFAYTDVIINEKHPAFIYNSPRANPFDQYGSTVPFIKVAKGTDMNLLYDKLSAFCKELYPSMYGASFFQRLEITRLDKIFFTDYMPESYFHTGNYKNLLALLVVALFLLLTALLNFININAALAGKRAKEMASRRLLGASKASIFGRYIGESIVITAICTVLAVLIAVYMTPMMNRVIDANVPANISFSPKYMTGYLLLIVVTGTVSALIPAFLASRYKPVDVVKGTFRAEKKRIFSKIFIVVQGTLAVFMISMSVLMSAQFRKSLNRPVNADIQDKFYLAYSVSISQLQSKSGMPDKLRKLPCVKNVGISLGAPGTPVGGQYSLTATGDEILYRTFFMDSTSFKMLNFNKIKDFNTPMRYGVWFGESAFKATGLDDEHYDIGTLAERSGWCTHTAGVIKDIPVNISNVGAEEYMLVSVIAPEDFRNGWLIETIGDHDEAKREITACGEEFLKNLTGIAFEPMYSGYLTDMFRKGLGKTENQMKLVNILMFLIVVIAILGLVAMSIYDAEEKANDIAVRKVYGSTVGEELSRGVSVYMKLIAVSCIIALPFAIWAAGKYLEQFIVKINNYFWIFIVALLITLAVSFVSIFWQILTAARTNPATTLRKE